MSEASDLNEMKREELASDDQHLRVFRESGCSSWMDHSTHVPYLCSDLHYLQCFLHPFLPNTYTYCTTYT